MPLFKKFVLCHLIALTLLATFLLPQTAPVWAKVDLKFAHLTESILKAHPLMPPFWAVANAKVTDIILIVLMVITSLIWAVKEGSFYTLLHLLKPLTFGILFCKVITSKALAFFEFYRISPSLALPHLTSLSKTVPWVYVKAGSTTSFPGDHACVFFLLALLFCQVASRPYAIVTLVLALMGSVPRLFAHAHWFSDLAVGSVCLLLLTLAWTFVWSSGNIFQKTRTSPWKLPTTLKTTPPSSPSTNQQNPSF